MALRLRNPEGRPWTLKEIVQGRPLGHPTHALLVHYPVALTPAVAALDLIARASGDAGGFVRAATYLAIAAAGLGIIAAVPGIVDWWGMAPGSTKRRVATRHFLIQALTIALVAASAGLHWPDRAEPEASWPATALAIAATLTVMLGNYFGGELVYRMGMRVSTVERAAERRAAGPDAATAPAAGRGPSGSG